MTKLYKTKIKLYPNGDKTLTVYKSAISSENISNSVTFSDVPKKVQSDDEKQLEKMRSIWKVKTKIKDYVL